MVSMGTRLRNRHTPLRRRVANLPEFQPREAQPIELTSESFPDGGAMSLRYSGKGRGPNVSPQLAWTGVPPGTQQLLLVVEDPDVPLPVPIIHCAALFAPTGASGEITENELTLGGERFTFLPWLGMRGYRGPTPLRGQGDHHYGFHLFALDQRFPAASYRKLRRQLKGHVLARGCLTGVQSYE